MKTFESFIESDAFFAMLIILLILLIAVFVWIVMANKKEAQKQREKRQIMIDESAEIKIIDKNHQRIELKTMDDVTNSIEDEEPERDEIAIVQEVAPINHEKNITYSEINEEDYLDDEFKKFDDPVNYQISDDSIKVPNLFIDESDSENNDISSNEKSDVELPMVKEQVEEEETHEMTEEEKAIEEAFAIPDFDNLLEDEDIEDEIIKAANDYIAEIMKKEDD